MRRRRRARRATEEFNLSFLDIIACGLGAMTLLLVLTKIGEPGAIEQARQDLDKLIARLEEELVEIRGETTVLERDLIAKRQQVSSEEEAVARLRGDLSKIRGEFAATDELSQVNDILEGRMLAAQQRLTEEMKRLEMLQRSRPQPETAPVGGIPVDSEYVIFIVDTSGSMTGYAWPLVLEKMEEVLEIYPRVKGIQVMNDMGHYMFTSYAGNWIPDTPGRRKAILQRLRTWSVFSNSSPVEGITRAITTFARGDKKISLYVFGDEFSGGSIDEVLASVRRLNRRDSRGNARVRIHGIGFPVMFEAGGANDATGVRFATLMRLLCEQNDGSFVALSSLR
jgi:hypothetical protein